YPKVSFFFFFLITVFLAVLDEFLYRYKRYPRLSEESTSGISAFYGASVSYALAANQCFFKTPEREEIIDEIHGNSEETECSPLAESLIERKPIIYNGKIALPYP
ncbi:MAG: hypothetical protein U9R24_04330, partial [Thermodesulfobacteriota bacterium]|nr:hypothetical protein [Thermodesulfobacteriota bacterium]